MHRQNGIHAWITSHYMFPTLQPRYCPGPTYFDSIPVSITMEDIFNKMKKENLVDPRVQVKDAMFYITAGPHTWANYNYIATRAERKELEESVKKEILNEIETINPSHSVGETNFKITLGEILRNQQRKRLFYDWTNADIRIYFYWDQIFFKMSESSIPISFIFCRGDHFDKYYRKLLDKNPKLQQSLERVQIRSGPNCLDYILKKFTIKQNLSDIESEKELTFDANYQVQGMLDGQYHLIPLDDDPFR